MSLSTDEKTNHDGQPRELYQFEIEGGTDYFYTDFREDIVSGDNYVSANITRGPIRGGSMRPEALEVRVPYDLPILDDIAFDLPPREVKLILRRYHGNIGNIGTIWTGFVTGVTVSGRQATLRVPSLLGDQLSGVLPSIAFRGACNHYLYDTRCGISAAAHQTNTTVAAIGADERAVTVTALDDTDYEGGEIVRVSDGERRLIVSRAGLVLTLLRKFRALSVADNVQVFEGCTHAFTFCGTKFANQINYGGHPNIQTLDVFRHGVFGDS